eukprot:5090915-Pleurochrysis_carterae.AAC.1
MDEMPSVAREPAKNLQHEWVTTCPRHSASWYFACWNVGGEPQMEESRQGSVFAKATVALRVVRRA